MMRQLYDLVKEKDYFVVTTNGEDHFVPAGFSPERVFEMEGKIRRCAVPEVAVMKSITTGKRFSAWRRQSRTVLFHKNCCLCVHDAEAPWMSTWQTTNAFSRPGAGRKNDNLSEFYEAAP